MRRNGSAFRQFLLLFLSIIAAFALMLKLDLAGRLAYSIEKARLRALRDTLPSEEELARLATPSRRVAAIVSPSVVSITTERVVDWPSEIRSLLGPNVGSNGVDGNERTDPSDIPDDELHRRFFERGEEPSLAIRTGVGSGFVFDADQGLILTNHHVVEDADVIRVLLADGRHEKARLVGSDPKTDLAVIGIESDHLFALPLGDSTSARVGDEVFAVGNPFGYGGSFSRGIVSAKGRSNIPLLGVYYQRFIQTDAVINPGNSGGPLVNMRGEVIGINTAIASQSGTYDGVGFAIPSERVRQLLPQLVRGGPIIRGYLGIAMADVRDWTPRAAKLHWDESTGIIIRDVLTDTPAERDGLRADDILINLNGEPILDLEDVRETVALTPPGSRITFDIWRDARRQTLQVEVGRQPDDFPRIPTRRGREP
jgi:S1-C subfamily serine protease